jgi:hypothetical protein
LGGNSSGSLDGATLGGAGGGYIGGVSGDFAGAGARGQVTVTYPNASFSVSDSTAVSDVSTILIRVPFGVNGINEVVTISESVSLDITTKLISVSDSTAVTDSVIIKKVTLWGNDGKSINAWTNQVKS